ncbi:MAG: dual specificity protein phosphatase [Pleurocapsa sp. MO_226.B13]|nr:dual specificity protein phosphatase [Pleurocapsa sp. MO_226.B13]
MIIACVVPVIPCIFAVQVNHNCFNEIFLKSKLLQIFVGNFIVVQLFETHPSLNSIVTLYMLETFGASVKLFSSHTPEEICVQLWTNTLNKFNSEGNWHPIELSYQASDAENSHIFGGSFTPTSQGNYQFTYRVRLKRQPEQWQWAGKYGENGYLSVLAPSPEMNWTQGASYVEVMPSVYVGNFIAASNAVDLGFDSVLNLAEEFILDFPPDAGIAYKHLKLKDGAQHPIANEVISIAIAWIEQQLERGKKKVLINCRAGIGRSGSIVLAYCFYKHSQWSYRQALDYIWSKKADIYPHKHLQNSLERLFTRSKSS